MPRDLSDVLHYFLPELGGAVDAPLDSPRSFSRRADSATVSASRRRMPPLRRDASPLPLSILGVPLGERDVVHAAYTWNLAVETARLGGSSAILTPDGDRAAPFWPASGSGRVDVEIVHTPARNLADLRRSAAELAEARGRSARQGGVVFAHIPPAWLDATEAQQDPATDGLRWLLLFTSARRREIDSTFEGIRRWVRARPGLEVGVAIQGVGRIDEARDAFDELARRCDQQLGVSLASYGLLVDDLDVYRAIAAGRPVNGAHPDRPAARALTDVARLIYEDARSRVLG